MLLLIFVILVSSFLNVPNFRHFEDVVFNVRIHSSFLFSFLIFFLHQLFLVCPLLCFLLLLSSVYLLEPEEDDFCRNRLCTIVSLCFVVLVSTFP